jgi:5-methyltetrahydrofolate corrinoid/iron sulfur protein methyltransferase
MILVGENLNIMSKSLGPALRERNPEPVREMARLEDAADIDYLDLNIGPARKAGDEFMAWVVQTVQAVTKKPISLDTTNPVAMEAGLKVCKNKTLINSISLQPDRLAAELPFINKYNADMIGLLWGVEGMPRDANERCMLAVDLVYKANEQGISNDKIWIDPIATPVSGEINQLKASFEFMAMLQDIAPGCKSIVGLSNVSNGTPDNLRPYLNRTYMMMLLKFGLHAAIVDAFDKELIAIARGQRAERMKMVHQMMEGYKPAIAGLAPEEQKYARTVRVLLGESLYSHSWLEV